MHIRFAELPVFGQDRAKSFYLEHFRCHVATDLSIRRNLWRRIELKFEDADTTLHFVRRKRESSCAEPVWMRMWEVASPRSSPNHKSRPGRQRAG